MADPRSPKSPRKGKVVSLRVLFLKDTVHAFQIPVKAVGQVLWDAVINHQQLLESDYFGLEYTNHNGDECWLDCNKQILKQLPSPDSPLRFGVKFYTPDPGLLEDELTRYCFALQIRRDLYSGELHCSENTAALLASYIVQGEIGDFLVDEFVDISYLSAFDFVPKGQQTVEMLHKVMDYHRQHVGESPSEADSNLLDTARKVEMYGIKFHPAKDHEGVALHLAVAHLGVLVFQGMTKINTFSWAKVRKLSFKRKKFLIKLHPESYAMRKNESQENKESLSLGYYKDTVEFFFDSRDRCKYFWKKCIEHHTFFRCQTVKKPPRNKARVVSRGSSFRYSGRTQKELQEYVRESVVKRPQVERSTSGRISSRSTSVTPKFSAKPSMHNSSDLHNSTASSGSHILETSSGLPPLPPTRLETAEVHSDSSMSGSRSLGSPRLEHGLSADSEGGDFINQPVDVAAVDARLPHSDSAGADSDFDKFDDIPLSVSDHVILPPDVPYSNLLQSHLHQDDENVTDADVDDEFDNDDKVPSNSVLSANQNAKDSSDSETQLKSLASADNVVEYVNSQSLAADQTAAMATTTASSAPPTQGAEDDSTSSAAITGVKREEGDAEKGTGKVDRYDSVMVDADSKPHPSPVEGEAAATATAAAATAMPVQDQPATTPSKVSLPLPVSVTQAQVHATQGDELQGPTDMGKMEMGTVTSSSLSAASPLLVDADLNEDIPYVLHRRQYKDSEDQQETKVFKSAETPSPQATLLRQSRSKSPRGRLLHEDSCSPEGRGRKSRTDRSPSAGRRFELVHYNKLPARDSFSSVDDTTSPTFEKDFLKQGHLDSPQIESKPLGSVSQPDTREVESTKDVKKDLPSKTELDSTQAAEVEKPPEEEVVKIDWLDSQPNVVPPEPQVIAKGTEVGAEKDLQKERDDSESGVEKPDKDTVRKQVEKITTKETGKISEDVQQKIPMPQKVSPKPGVAVTKAAEILQPPSPPLPPPPSSPPLPPPPPPPRPQNPTAEMGPNLTPMLPVLTTISTNTVTVAKPLVAAKPKPPPVMPKSTALAKKPPVAPKTKIIPVKPPRETGPHAPSSSMVQSPPPPLPPPITSPVSSATTSTKTSLSHPALSPTGPPSSSAAADDQEFPPPPSEMTSSLVSVSGDIDLDSLPPPPSELLMDLSSQSSGTSPESPASLPPLPPEISMTQSSASVRQGSIPDGQKAPAKEKRPGSIPFNGKTSDQSQDKGKMNGETAWGKQKNQGEVKASTDSIRTSEAQRIMDLPSPAAALMFSDNDSPPAQTEAPTPALTFTTFRPDPSEVDSIVTVTATSTMTSVPSVSVSDLGSNSSASSGLSTYSTSPRDPLKRWSLERVEEEPSTEAGENGEKPKAEPKRVSWHEEGEAAHSYHSDVSLAVMPSPVDEVSSSLGGSPHRDDMDSGDILETLENLRRQGSESDLTYSGSSGSSRGSDEDDCSTAKEVYLQYAASKCLAESGKDTTIDSGMGEMSSEGTMTTTASHQRESSPLDTLERLGSLEGSFVSDTRKPSFEDFPPPPPFLRSGGSTSSSSSLEMAAAAAMASVGFAEKRASVDPLLNLEGRDLVEVAYTTSESESDFDEEAEMNKLKKLSPECEGAVGGMEASGDGGENISTGADGSGGGEGSLHVVSEGAHPYSKHKSTPSSNTRS